MCVKSYGDDSQEALVGATTSGRGPSLADVASAAGVSPALASLALRGLPGPSDASRAAIIASAKKLGYRANFAASMLARSRTRLIGVVFDIAEQFHSEVVEDLYVAAGAADYDLLLGAITRHRSLAEAIAPLASGPCEGIIIIGVNDLSQEILSGMGGAPLVVIGHARPNRSFDVVRTADDIGVGTAIDALVGLGHRNIVHVDGGDASGAQERRNAYQIAMTRNDLPQHVCIVRGGSSQEKGFEAASRLLNDFPSTTAIMAYDDTCAVGVLRAAHKYGFSVPRDISIVGYDNDRISYKNFFSISTVAQNTQQISKIAVNRIIQAVEDPTLQREEFVVTPDLILRDTTSSPRPQEIGE